jgi:cold shock CspA family protein
MDTPLHLASAATTTTVTTTPVAADTSTSADTSASKFTGRVKWFNNKSGYGFVTVVSSDLVGSVVVGSDVFAHHSEIAVTADQYRYLVQGEYVEFCVANASSGNHEFQCSKIRGIHSGQLICETRHSAREMYKSSSTQPTPKSLASSFEPTGLIIGDSGDRKYSNTKPFRGGGTGTGTGTGRGRGGIARGDSFRQ